MATMLATSLLLILCLTGISAQEVCNTYGSLRRDPYDCQRYYSCDDHYRNDFTCPQGQVFNEETSQCDSSGRVIGCENGRSRTGDYCNPINPCLHGTCESLGNTFNCTCNDGWMGAYCNYTTNWWSTPRQPCDSTNGIYRRDPNNCRRYNLCDTRYTEDYYCQTGEAFNEEVQRCDSSGTVRGCGSSTSRSRSSGYSRNQCRRHCDHGHCAIEGNHYVCRCNDDYSGERCQNPPASSASGTSGRTYTSLIQCSGNCDRGYCEPDGSNYRCRQPVQVSGTSSERYRSWFDCSLSCESSICERDGNDWRCRQVSQVSGTSSERYSSWYDCTLSCESSNCERDGNDWRCRQVSQVSGTSGRSYSSFNQCRLYCDRRNCVQDGNYYICRETSQVSGTSGRSYRFLRQCSRHCEGGNCERDGNDWRCRQTSQAVAEACRSNRCVNGRCQASGNSYRCVCDPNFSGRYCDQRTGFGSERCNPNPCFNNGRCQLVGAESFQCFCPEGYAGGQCRDIDHCFPNPCGNGESCRLTTYRTDYECTRGSGSFSNRCNPNPCFNSGRCQLVGANDFECFCAEGYAGRQCRDIDYCFPNPCGNGERCQLTTDGRDYECIRGEA